MSGAMLRESLPLAAASIDGATLREVPFLAQVSLRADPALAPVLAAAAGVALPLEPNTAARVDDRAALWLGPAEWLVIGPEDTESAIEAALRAALVGAHGSVVDVSANRTMLELRGHHARDVLVKGCALDLRPRAFGPGRCAQTLLARVRIIIEQVSDDPTYRLLVRRSFAPQLARWLVDAMAQLRVTVRALAG